MATIPTSSSDNSASTSKNSTRRRRKEKNDEGGGRHLKENTTATAATTTTTGHGIFYISMTALMGSSIWYGYDQYILMLFPPFLVILICHWVALRIYLRRGD